MLRTCDLHSLYNVAQAVRITHNLAIFEDPVQLMLG
jgi:hypothetical protein